MAWIIIIIMQEDKIRIETTWIQIKEELDTMVKVSQPAILKSQWHKYQTYKEDNSFHTQGSTSQGLIIPMMVCFLVKFHKYLILQFLQDHQEFLKIQSQCHLESMAKEPITRRLHFGRHNNNILDSKSTIKCLCMEIPQIWD